MSQQQGVERTPKDKEINEQKALPVLPVRDTVLFPHAVLPLTVGRESSVQLINSLGEDKTIIGLGKSKAWGVHPINAIHERTLFRVARGHGSDRDLGD